MEIKTLQDYSREYDKAIRDAMAEAWDQGVRIATDHALLVGAGAKVDELRNPYRN